MNVHQQPVLLVMDELLYLEKQILAFPALQLARSELMSDITLRHTTSEINGTQ